MAKLMVVEKCPTGLGEDLQIGRPSITGTRGAMRSIDPHEFESVGDILRRLLTDAETQLATREEGQE